MSKKVIGYIGGCWASNIGNAFIDMGSMYSLKTAVKDSEVHIISDFAKTLYALYGKDTKTKLNLIDKIKCDYIVISGPLDNIKFPKTIWPLISRLIKKYDTKVIYNGVGASTYSFDEGEDLHEFYKQNPPYAYISRDETSYLSYGSFAKHSFDGIDCGFFVSDCFNPVKLDLPKYVIHNFDKTKGKDFITSPFNLLVTAIKTKYGLHRYKKPVNKQVEKDMIIRTHHSYVPYVSNKVFGEANTFISGIPEDYLNLYANTEATYSSRVHACVATLAFNKPARLYNNTPRSYLLDRVGAKKIRESLCYVDADKLRVYKLNQLNFLSEIIK